MDASSLGAANRLRHRLLLGKWRRGRDLEYPGELEPVRPSHILK